MDQQKEFLRVKDIVKMGFCSQGQAYILMNTKGFPSIRVGKSLRVRRADFEKWINEHMNEGTVVRR